MLGDFISKLSSFFRGRIIFPVFRPTSKKKPSPNWISKNAKHFVLPEWRHSTTGQQLRLRPEKQTQFPLCLFCRMCCRVLPAGSRVPGFGQMMPTSGHWTALWGPVMGFSGFEKSNHFWPASTGNPSTAGVHHLRPLWAPINLAESVGEKNWLSWLILVKSNYKVVWRVIDVCLMSSVCGLGMFKILFFLVSNLLLIFSTSRTSLKAQIKE